MPLTPKGEGLSPHVEGWALSSGAFRLAAESRAARVRFRGWLRRLKIGVSIAQRPPRRQRLVSWSTWSTLLVARCRVRGVWEWGWHPHFLIGQVGRPPVSELRRDWASAASSPPLPATSLNNSHVRLPASTQSWGRSGRGRAVGPALPRGQSWVRRWGHGHGNRLSAFRSRAGLGAPRGGGAAASCPFPCPGDSASPFPFSAVLAAGRRRLDLVTER